MTYDELKIMVAQSANVDWYNQRQLEVKNVHTGYHQKIDGLLAVHKYISDQISFFSEFEKLPPEFQRQKKIFDNAKSQIEQLVQSNQTNLNLWNQAVSSLQDPNTFFAGDSSATSFLMNVFLTQPNYYQGAYEFLVGTTNSSNNKNYLVGYLLAYEFVNSDASLINSRSNNEQVSIEKLKTDLKKQSVESENQLATYIRDAYTAFQTHANEITDYKIEVKKKFDDWFSHSQTSNKEFYDNADKRLKNLELLYQEKLQLEAPANYWRKRARKLNSQAYIWLACLTVSLGVTVWILLSVLHEFQNDKIQQIFTSTGVAIKWSIILITTISFLAFAIRTFAKLTFSSFHLSRDAEEREQLTYVYLALQKEKGIDKTERHLIMQSIFSRADTGLLKDDGGPTMPGNFMEQAKNIASGK